tara:strand:+ start:1158 stop:1490 length:333 start_codon:yes stop_codon:yes gene_type:complete
MLYKHRTQNNDHHRQENDDFPAVAWSDQMVGVQVIFASVKLKNCFSSGQFGIPKIIFLMKNHSLFLLNKSEMRFKRNAYEYLEHQKRICIYTPLFPMEVISRIKVSVSRI